MSTVTKIECIACTPQAGDLNGIRRPIAGGVTSEEIFNLVQHVVTVHTKGDHHGGLQADNDPAPPSSVNRTAAGAASIPVPRLAPVED